MRVKKNKKLVMKGRRTRNNLYKVQVFIVPGGAKQDEVMTGVVGATESGEDSDAGSCE